MVRINSLSVIKKIFSDEVVVIPGPLNQSYFPVLDGFRGIAILTVIIGHVSIGTTWGQYFKGNVELFKYANSPLLNIPALFLVASLSYYLFEKRFLRLKNRFK